MLVVINSLSQLRKRRFTTSCGFGISWSLICKRTALAKYSARRWSLGSTNNPDWPLLPARPVRPLLWI